MTPPTIRREATWRELEWNVLEFKHAMVDDCVLEQEMKKGIVLCSIILL